MRGVRVPEGTHDRVVGQEAFVLPAPGLGRMRTLAYGAGQPQRGTDPLGVQRHVPPLGVVPAGQVLGGRAVAHDGRRLHLVRRRREHQAAVAEAGLAPERPVDEAVQPEHAGGVVPLVEPAPAERHGPRVEAVGGGVVERGRGAVDVPALAVVGHRQQEQALDDRPEDLERPDRVAGPGAGVGERAGEVAQRPRVARRRAVEALGRPPGPAPDLAQRQVGEVVEQAVRPRVADALEAALEGADVGLVAGLADPVPQVPEDDPERLLLPVLGQLPAQGVGLVVGGPEHLVQPAHELLPLLLRRRVVGVGGRLGGGEVDGASAADGHRPCGRAVGILAGPAEHVLDRLALRLQERVRVGQAVGHELQRQAPPPRPGPRGGGVADDPEQALLVGAADHGVPLLGGERPGGGQRLDQRGGDPVLDGVGPVGGGAERRQREYGVRLVVDEQRGERALRHQVRREPVPELLGRPLVRRSPQVLRGMAPQRRPHGLHQRVLPRPVAGVAADQPRQAVVAAGQGAGEVLVGRRADRGGRRLEQGAPVLGGGPSMAARSGGDVGRRTRAQQGGLAGVGVGREQVGRGRGPDSDHQEPGDVRRLDALLGQVDRDRETGATQDLPARPERLRPLVLRYVGVRRRDGQVGLLGPQPLQQDLVVVRLGPQLEPARQATQGGRGPDHLVVGRRIGSHVPAVRVADQVRAHQPEGAPAPDLARQRLERRGAVVGLELPVAPLGGGPEPAELVARRRTGRGRRATPRRG